MKLLHYVISTILVFLFLRSKKIEVELLNVLKVKFVLCLEHEAGEVYK